MKSPREKIVESVLEELKSRKLAADPNVAEAAVYAMLQWPLDVVHYAKDEKPKPRIRILTPEERTDGWRERVQSRLDGEDARRGGL